MTMWGETWIVYYLTLWKREIRVKIRHQVRMSGKELSRLESPGADISHLIICPCYMEGGERRCLTGPLPVGEEAEESGCGDG